MAVDSFKGLDLALTSNEPLLLWIDLILIVSKWLTPHRNTLITSAVIW